MAFSGYVFENAQAITPYLEEPRLGPTSLFCSDLAKKLNCYVLAGYPEKLHPNEPRPPVAASTTEAENADPTHDPHLDPEAGSVEGEEEHRAVGANSAVMYDPEGEWVGGYRKTNLYTTDKTWAKAGNGFATFHLPSPLNTLALGICMDLNTLPDAPWTSIEDGPYEFAEHAVKQDAKVVVLLNNWLHSSKDDEEGDEGVDSERDDDDEHDWRTLQYWALRLRPLWAESESLGKEDRGEAGSETVVVVCNRSGIENGTRFAGTSAIYSMVRGSGRPKLLDMMGKEEEGIRVWNITV